MVWSIFVEYKVVIINTDVFMSMLNSKYYISYSAQYGINNMR